MRITTNLISVALLLSSWGATAALPRTHAQKAIETAVSREPFNAAVTGIFAMRMDGDTIVDINRRQRMVPASNMKLITTGLALKTLGGDFRFKTKIACSGEISGSVLKGDIYIIGGGDPTTGSKSGCAESSDALFSKWASFLKENGIKTIEGKVIGDPRFFPAGTAENLGWTYDDLGANYGVGPLGLNFFENAQNIIVTAGPSEGSRPSVKPTYPSLPWLVCLNGAVTGAPRSSNTLFYVNSDLVPYGEVRGSFPIDRKGGYLLESSNRFGALTCAYYFYEYLKKSGIQAKGGYADVTSSGYVRTDPGIRDSGVRAASQAELTVLGTTESAPLSSIVADANCESDNFYAEAMFKMMGLARRHSVEYEDCQKAADEALGLLGLRNGGAVQIFDGSGLSRKNYVSADFFVRFLRAMAESSVYEEYFQSLPVPGGEGTLKARFPRASQDLKSRIHMKSGSMNGVRSYSGYILSPDGDPSRTIVFSLLLNNLTASTWVTSPAIDAIIETIAAEN